ncbi:MAG: hypothetical protein FWD58_03150 [Firmicutes bacterium]|nr:hypothetical protein [Bacillota bacterium]
MSLLGTIKNKLIAGNIPAGSIGLGQYPDTESAQFCKVVFTNKDKPAVFLGSDDTDIETFKVIIRGVCYSAMETLAGTVKSVLKAAEYIPLGGYEDVEPKEGDAFMYLAVNFKSIKKS